MATTHRAMATEPIENAYQPRPRRTKPKQRYREHGVARLYFFAGRTRTYIEWKASERAMNDCVETLQAAGFGNYGNVWTELPFMWAGGVSWWSPKIASRRLRGNSARG